MTSSPPGKTTSRKAPATAGKKAAAATEVAATARKAVAVEPVAKSPKSAQRTTAAKKPIVTAKRAAEPVAPSKTPVATGNMPAPAVALGEPQRKAVARMHATPATLSASERHHLVEVAAYYIALRRGFGPGSHHDDWLQAEREVDAMIAAGKFGT